MPVYPDPELYPDADLYPSGDTVAERVLGFLDHLRIDEESDLLLEQHITALTVPAEPLGEIAYSTHRILRDPRYAPLWALPYAAQYTGGTMPVRQPGENDEAYLHRARLAVIRPRGMRRGGEGSLRDLIAPLQTGSQYVRVYEKWGDDSWETRVYILENETVLTDAELEAILNAADTAVAGEHVHIHAALGWDLGQMLDAYDDLDDMLTTPADLNQLLSEAPTDA